MTQDPQDITVGQAHLVHLELGTQEPLDPWAPLGSLERLVGLV